MAMLSSTIIPTTLLDANLFSYNDSPKTILTLENKRKETQAIRELWLDLQTRKHRLQEQEHFVCRIVSSRERRDDTINGFLTFPARLTGSAPAFLGLRKQKKEKGEIPYHTAITKPPTKKLKSAGFNALNRKQLVKLPDVYDNPQGIPSFTTKDIGEWKNEVTKIVPRRPNIYTSTTCRARDLSQISPPEKKMLNDTQCFFHPILAQAKRAGREYVVNPEWPSEEITPQSVKNRAKCVYTWPI